MPRYLLIPAMPTPNGPLHLGHVSGPYLRMDVLARHLRRTGSEVWLISASDGWETHVLPRADAEGKSAQAVCNEYHEVILDCFGAIGIEFDRFFNPLSDEYCGRAEAIYRSVFAEVLKNEDEVIFRNEMIPVSSVYGEPVLGSYIGGICPGCGVEDLGGFYCEDCGVEAQPQDLGAPWSERANDSFEWQRARSAFLLVKDRKALRADIETRCSDRALIDLAFNSVRLNGGATRLTHPGNWGVTVAHGAELSPMSRAFSYPGMFTLSLLCAEIAHEELGCSAEPFSPNSEVITVKSFGYDNTVPYLIGATLIGQLCANIRPFDVYLTNHFATLDGRKFSTSAQHAIWANEALEELRTDTDTLRAYMCLANPQFERSDFSRTGFADYAAKWNAAIARVMTGVRPGQLAHSDAAALCVLFKEQLRTLEPSTFDLKKAFLTLDAWLGTCPAGGWNAAYSVAFAALAYPFVPETSLKIIGKFGSDIRCGQTGGEAGTSEWRSIQNVLSYLTSKAEN